MIHAKHYAMGISQIQKIAQTAPQEKLVSIQFCGPEPEVIANAAKKAEASFSSVDINMGCPSPKIVKLGAGAGLLKKPEMIKAIVAKAVKSVDIPVTVKIR